MAAFDTFSESRLASNTSQKVIAWGVVLAVCYYAQPVVITFFFSLLCAFLLEPAVGLLTHFRLPRPLAALLVCLLALVVLYLVGALFYSRGAAFLEELPRYESTIKGAVEKISQRVQTLEATFMRFAACSGSGSVWFSRRERSTQQLRIGLILGAIALLRHQQAVKIQDRD